MIRARTWVWGGVLREELGLTAFNVDKGRVMYPMLGKIAVDDMAYGTKL